LLERNLDRWGALTTAWKRALLARDWRAAKLLNGRRRLRRAQKAAGLRPLRFHDVRHSFGSLVVRDLDTATLKSWMGHAKLTTTERYLHAKPRHSDSPAGEPLVIDSVLITRRSRVRIPPAIERKPWISRAFIVLRDGAGVRFVPTFCPDGAS